MVHPRPGNLRTAAIAKDGGPYNVRQVGLGDCGGLRGTAGDCQVKFFVPFNNFVCQAEVGTCLKDNKRSDILF